MRDKNIFDFRRALPRMSWDTRNLYNLYQRTFPSTPKRAAITFQTSTETLFKQRWVSKAACRAYHGDIIPEKIFKRWYLPATLPDVRPKRVSANTSAAKAELEAYAKRKVKEKDYQQAEQTKGLAPVLSLMFGEVERRVDTIIFRSCFAGSVYEARRMVVHGYVKLNGQKHTNPNTRLAPGDMLTVHPHAIRFLRRPQGGKNNVDMVNARDPPEQERLPACMTRVPGSKQILTPFHLPLYASPHIFVPAYLEVSYLTCSVVYVRHPTARPGYSELPTPYDADGEVIRFAWEWYAKRRVRVRDVMTVGKMARMPEDRTVDADSMIQARKRKRERKVINRKKTELKARFLSRSSKRR